MPELVFHGGAIKDEEDKRDFSAVRLLVREVAVPDTYITNPGTIIYDQGQTPECVGFSAVGVKTDEEFLDPSNNGKQIRFDGHWVYVQCKKEDNYPGPGSYPRVACKVLQQQGCKVLSSAKSVSKVWPCNWFKPTPPEPTPDEIARWKIDAYYRIEPNSTIEFVKQIIYQFGTIELASLWYPNWMDKFSVFPKPTGVTHDGHAYRGYGYNPVGVYIPNSWGTILWGVNGIAIMPWQIFLDYVLKEGDCWKLVDKKG